MFNRCKGSRIDCVRRLLLHRSRFTRGKGTGYRVIRGSYGLKIARLRSFRRIRRRTFSSLSVRIARVYVHWDFYDFQLFYHILDNLYRWIWELCSRQSSKCFYIYNRYDSRPFSSFLPSSSFPVSRLPFFVCYLSDSFIIWKCAILSMFIDSLNFLK